MRTGERRECRHRGFVGVREWVGKRMGWRGRKGSFTRLLFYPFSRNASLEALYLLLRLGTPRERSGGC